MGWKREREQMKEGDGESDAAQGWAGRHRQSNMLLSKAETLQSTAGCRAQASSGV